MIPILYGETTTNFNNQGIGSLSDAISCTVTEERNGIFELEMTYPVNGKHYSDISHSKIIKATPRPGGNDQLFRIYGITRPINGVVTINAEHISYQLSYIPVKTFEAASLTEALSDLTSYVPTGVECPFTITSTMTSTTAYENRVVANIREKLGGSEGSILDVYGGEWEFDNYTVKLWQNRGANRDVTLRYGKNITDITQEENIANTYTGAVGYYASGDGDYVETDVINTASTSAYPFKRIEVVDLSSEFDDGAPDKEELTEGLQTYMAKHQYGIPKVSIKVSFVQLWQTEEYKDIAPLERVWLCDTINVQFEKLGISTTAKIVKVVYNVLLDRYDSIEVGETTANLSDRVASQEIETKQEVTGTKNLLEQAISRATNAINGQNGGYVVIDANADGEPTQILIMNTPKKEGTGAATKVWRWNLSGLGYSNHGVNGPYETAITADGEIVADFITTGTMKANRIEGGTLASIDSTGGVKNFLLNLQTGAIKTLSLSVDSPNFKLTEAGVITMLKGAIHLGVPGQGSFWVDDGVATLDSAILSNIYIPGATNCDFYFGENGLDIRDVDSDHAKGRLGGGSDGEGHTGVVLMTSDGNDLFVQSSDALMLTGSDGIYLTGDLHPSSNTTGQSGSFTTRDKVVFTFNKGIVTGVNTSEQISTTGGTLTLKVGTKITFQRGLLTAVDTSEAVSGMTGTINGIGDSSGNYYCDIEVEKGIIKSWTGWRHV